MKLERIWWTDITNVAGGWHNPDELAEFATNCKWECNNTGWVVYEDDDCVVLSGRMTNDGNQVGMIERIPKKVIDRREVLYKERGK